MKPTMNPTMNPTTNPATPTLLYVDDDAALAVKRPQNISADHVIAGIRAGGKYRIFGFRFGAYFLSG